MKASPCVGCDYQWKSKDSHPKCKKCLESGKPYQYHKALGNMTYGVPLSFSDAGGALQKPAIEAPEQDSRSFKRTDHFGMAARNQQILDLASEYNSKEIAEMLNITYRTVYHQLQKAGVKAVPNPRWVNVVY